MDAVGREVGARIKKSREATRLSQEEVARELHLSRQAISKWENGKSHPTLSEFRELCILFGVSADYLLLGIRTVPASKSALLRGLMNTL